MPALPPVPGTLRADLEWSVGTDVLVRTRFFFSYTGTAPSAGDCDTIASDLYTSAAAHFPPLMVNDNSLIGVTVTDLASSSGAQGSHAATTAGSNTGFFPAGTAALFNYTISRRYRGGKPRSYMPLGDAAELGADQTWLSSFVTACDSAISAFITAATSIVVSGTTITNHVNVSYYQGFASVQNPITHRWKNLSTPRTVPVVDVITSASLNPKPGSQRRRYQR